MLEGINLKVCTFKKKRADFMKQEAHGPQLAHLSNIATADM